MFRIKHRPAGTATGWAPARPFWGLVSSAAVAACLCSSCSTMPANKLLLTEGRSDVMRQVLARKNRLVALFPESDARKPVLVLLHGATSDPTEMLDIAHGARERYQVYLFSYNHHQGVERIASDLVREFKRLKTEKPAARTTTVVVYSYSAIIFRQAVVSTPDPGLFAETWLIQLAPTAGGSYLARGMRLPELAWLVSLASNPSVAENPYGRLARQLWEGQGERVFDATVPPDRVRTILVDDDHHSLAKVRNSTVLAHYQNGIGTNVVVIPSSFGVNHDYLPSNPIALEYVRTLLEPPPSPSKPGPAEVVGPQRIPRQPSARLVAHTPGTASAGGS
jgi:hypothetical protein